MKNILLWGIFLSLLFLVFGANHSFGQFTVSSETISDEEYKVYSAYIDQVYVNFHNDWFTACGEKLKTFAHIDKIEQVVLIPITMISTYSGFSSDLYRNKIPKELLERFIAKNEQSYKLTNKFKTKVNHYLFTQTLEEAQAYSAEVQRRKISYDTLFLEKYPKSPGTLSFFRAVFDASMENALLGIRQNDIYGKQLVVGRGSNDKLVLLSKVKKKWVVKKIVPEDEIISVNFSDCQPISRNYSLPFGVASFQVNGLKDGKCHISESTEIEGGYTVTDCFVPTVVGKALVTGGNYYFLYSVDLSGYCQKPKTGNIFFDSLNKKN
jgi:hypothetical protein